MGCEMVGYRTHGADVPQTHEEIILEWKMVTIDDADGEISHDVYVDVCHGRRWDELIMLAVGQVERISTATVVHDCDA